MYKSKPEKIKDLIDRVEQLEEQLEPEAKKSGRCSSLRDADFYLQKVKASLVFHLDQVIDKC